MYRSRSTLEIGFNAAVGTLDPEWINTGFTWTDVSADFLNYSWDAGGQEFDGVNPGEGSLTLENISGTYDPSNAASPYSGNMTKGKPFRIKEQLNLLSIAVAEASTTAGLTVIAGTLTTSAASPPRHGTLAYRITNGAGTIGFDTPSGTSGCAVVTPGEPMTASAWIKRTSATGRNATVSLRWYTAAGAFISTTAGSAVTTTAAYQQVYATGTAPATAAFVAMRISIAAAVIGDTHCIDDLHITPSDRDGNLTWYPGGPIEVCRGVINSWQPVQHHPGYSETTCEIAGTLSLVALRRNLESMWATMVERSKPSLWYRMGDNDPKAGATDSSGNNLHGSYQASTTAIVFSDGLIVNDGNGAVNFDAAALQYIELPSSFTWTSGTYTLAFWVQAVPGAATCTLFDSSRLIITRTANGSISVNALGLIATTTGYDTRDTRPHLVWVNVDAAGSVTVYIDGQVQASAAGIFGAERLLLRTYIGRDQANTPAQYTTSKLDEFVIWQDRTLDFGWYYIAGRAGAIRPGDFIGTLGPADVANWVLNPYTVTSPSGDELPRLNSVSMASPLEMLNTAATAGQLLISEWPDGTPSVEDLQYVPYLYWGAFIDPITIGQGTGEYGYIGEPTIDYGEASVINEVTVTRPDRSDITYRNQDSIDARGPAQASVTMWSSEDRYARDLANWLLNQYATEGRRITGIRPNTNRVDTAQAMLWLRIGDVITVKDLTVDGRTITTIVRVCGKHTRKRSEGEGGPASLVVTLDLSPIRIQPMVLDSSTYGVLGAAANTGKWGP